MRNSRKTECGAKQFLSGLVVRVASLALTCLISLAGVVGVIIAQSSTERSVWDAVYTADQAKRGEMLYANNCASCHGSALGGGESAPPLAGGEFFANWNGLTLGDLFDRIRVSMPADRPGKLGREQNADVLAFMLSVNQFPSGKAELEHQSEVLKQIRFEAEKPRK
ncbi:MAG TPA: cytochrome c [Bryobacteraceae bacterium]|nr:cytochrome c [Bryobacteraceae bacterium]